MLGVTPPLCPLDLVTSSETCAMCAFLSVRIGAAIRDYVSDQGKEQECSCFFTTLSLG